MQPLAHMANFKRHQMVKRKRMNEDDCPVARTLDAIGERWALLIVRDAFDGTRRFSDFQRSLGVARNILADRLRVLVDAGVMAIQPASDGSVYQEYVLTAAGVDLFPVVVALRQWGERHLFVKGEAHSRLLHKRSGKPLAAMLPRDAQGRAVGPLDARVEKVAAQVHTDAGDQ